MLFYNITRDKNIVQKMENDALINHGWAPLKLVVSYVKFIKHMKPQFPSIKVPILFTCGTGDIVTPPRDSEVPYKAVGMYCRLARLKENRKRG